ncbi:recombinase family protein [Nesterenkonia halophila]
MTTTQSPDVSGSTRTMIGYARISTGEQDAGGQIRELEEAGCSTVYVDQASGTKTSRPELDRMIEYLRPGDTVAVCRLDRLGRSLPHLIEMIQMLGERGVEFRSLSESIDTATSAGRLVFHIAASFAQFERDIISERTKAGLAQAAARGRRPGRPAVMTAEKIEAAESMQASGMSPAAIAAALGVSRTTIRRTLGKSVSR